MTNEVQDPNGTDHMSDTPMDSPEKLEKGKGKIAAMEQDPMEDSEEDSEEDEAVSSTNRSLIERSLTIAYRVKLRVRQHQVHWRVDRTLTDISLRRR